MRRGALYDSSAEAGALLDRPLDLDRDPPLVDGAQHLAGLGVVAHGLLDEVLPNTVRAPRPRLVVVLDGRRLGLGRRGRRRGRLRPRLLDRRLPLRPQLKQLAVGDARSLSLSLFSFFLSFSKKQLPGEPLSS